MAAPEQRRPGTPAQMRPAQTFGEVAFSKFQSLSHFQLITCTVCTVCSNHQQASTVFEYCAPWRLTAGTGPFCLLATTKNELVHNLRAFGTVALP